MGIKLIKKASEAATFTAIKNPEQAAFIIDCGSPEKAKALYDAFSALAEKVMDHDDKEAGDAIGGSIVMYYDVGPFFTACVDPCDKAAAWCEDWLRNSDGKAPGIQGNDAGLEGKCREELSAKMKQRLKIKKWQAATEKMKGFDEAGHTFLDMMNGEKLSSIFLPVAPKPTKEEGEKVAEKIFGDFEGYLDYGTDVDDAEDEDGEVWLPYYGLKKEFFDLSEEEGLEVLSELSDVLYRAYTKGA